MRVALYARYSSDLQNARSADDQLAALRQVLTLRGWTEVAAYRDEAISAATLGARPGVQALLADGQATPARFDLVMAEALDRLSRDQEGTAHLYKRLTHAGVAIETLSEGRIGVMHVGLAGTMNQMFLEQLAHKTRRGQVAVVKAGRSGGGRCYGYRIAGKGEFEIDEDQADIIRRIYRDYAAGHSPRDIAAALNAEGVEAPRGSAWAASTVLGDRRAGDGILCQELYVGRRVFNRRRFRKDPDSGKRSGVLNPREAWIIEEVPALRIVDDAAWTAVQERQRAISTQPAAYARRPKHLLSGLLRCGLCDGPMVSSGGRFQCSHARDRGVCQNRKAISGQAIQDRVLAGVRDNLLDPQRMALAVRTHHADMEAARKAALADRLPAERELAEVTRRLTRLTEQLAAGVLEPDDYKAVAKPLQDRRRQLEGTIASAGAAAPEIPRIHPGAAAYYETLAEGLHEALAMDDTGEVQTALRDLIARVDFHPAQGLGQYTLTVHGQLGQLLAWGQPQNAKNPPARTEGSGRLVGAGARSTRSATVSFAA